MPVNGLVPGPPLNLRTNTPTDARRGTNMRGEPRSPRASQLQDQPTEEGAQGYDCYRQIKQDGDASKLQRALGVEREHEPRRWVSGEQVPSPREGNEPTHDPDERGQRGSR